MNKSSMLKRMLFITIYILLFISYDEVLAAQRILAYTPDDTTKYLMCEYKSSDDPDYDMARYIFQNGKFFMGAGRKRKNQKWDASEKHHLYVYSKKTKKSLSLETNINSCPEVYYEGKSYNYTKGYSNLVELNSLECSYTSGETMYVDSNNLHGEMSDFIWMMDPIGSGVGFTTFDACPTGSSIYAKMNPNGTIENKDWSWFSNQWYFLKNQTNSCPPHLFHEQCYDTQALLTNAAVKYDIFTYDKLTNLSEVIGPAGYKEKLYMLQCNDKYVDEYSEYLSQTYASIKASADNFKDAHTYTGDYKNASKELTNINKQLSDFNKEMNEKIEYLEKLACNGKNKKTDKLLGDFQTYNDELTKKVNNLIDDSANNNVVSKKKAKRMKKKNNKQKKDSDKNAEARRSFLSNVKNQQKLECTDIFGKSCEKEPGSLKCFIVTVFKIITYIIPILLIVLGTFDFSKVVIANDKEAMPKAISTFILRVVIAVFIILSPIVVNLLLNIFNSAYTGEEKINCIVSGLAGDK